MRLRSRRRNLVTWSPVGFRGAPPFRRDTPIMRTRRGIRTSALLTVIGLMRLAGAVRTRWWPLLTGVTLTVAGIMMRSGTGGVVLIPGMLFLVRALLIPPGHDQDRKRRCELERELAGYSTPAERRDLEATLDRYPEAITSELRGILARQAMSAQFNRFPAVGRD